MSRQNIMQNGIPPHLNSHPMNNGPTSSQSSRDASPASKYSSIPTSQLPPLRGQIPATQLPPMKSEVSPVVNKPATITPYSSPQNANFKTSTPLRNEEPMRNLPQKSVETTWSNAHSQPGFEQPKNPPSGLQRPPAQPQQSPQIGLVQSEQQANPLQSGLQRPLVQIQQSLQMRLGQSEQQKNLPSGLQRSATQTQQPPQIEFAQSEQQTNPVQSGLQRPLAQTLPPLQMAFAQSEQQKTSLQSGLQTQQPPQMGLPQSEQQKVLLQRPSAQTQPLSQMGFAQSEQQTNVLQSGLQKPPAQTQQLLQPQKIAPPPGPTLFSPPVPNQMQQVSLNYPNASQNARPMLPPQQPLQNISSPVNPTQTQMSALHTKRYPQPPPQQNMYQPTNQNPPTFNHNLPSVNQNPSVVNQNPPTFNQNPATFNQNPPTFPPQPNIYNQQQSYPQKSYQQLPPEQTNVYSPPQNYQQKNYQQTMGNLNQQMSNLNVVQGGFNKVWGTENYDLLQYPSMLTEDCLEPPRIRLGQEFLDAANCSPEIFRCTMTKIPDSNSLLQKSRLPLGVLIHPFKDLNHLPVIHCNTIVRCRACRTYINPFIFFVDSKRWKCNLCYRVNELPEEFQYDPVSKSYGDPSRRPEIKSSTIEYIAPSEYMLRPPQPAVYLFLLDVSRLAVETGYLQTICNIISTQLDSLPGDARTQIGFLAYNSTLRFFSLAEGLNQPHEMIVSDIDDVFLPCPDNLLVNLKEHKDLVMDLLVQLPTRYQDSFDNGSVLGAALQAAFKLMSKTGGRVSVFQAALPMLGPGALTVREDPNQRAAKEAPHLNPATDFYKRLALDCSGHQIAVDLFILNSQYVDIATLSGISRFSGGCMYHFPLFKSSRPAQAQMLERCLQRYLTRKIGFEAVMRIRCTRGLSIHTFHGNFFVRSTDLLSLPNVNPDAGFGMQVSIDENLTDIQSVCFQAALLYTSSKGERRIRVHTLCIPIVSTLSEVLNSADQQCIVGLLSKMAVDRSLQSSLSDARDAFINVAIDVLASYKLSLSSNAVSSGLLVPRSLKLLPLYILALLKYTAFRSGQSTRLDDRLFAMCEMKTLPLTQLLQHVHPDLYSIHSLAQCATVVDEEGAVIPNPQKLQLTSRNIDSHGAYLLDAGKQMIIYVCQNVNQTFLTHTLGVPNFNSISDQCYELQKLDNVDNQRLHTFVNNLNYDKPQVASLHIMRENSPHRTLFLEHLIEDRFEFALSYSEFLQHLKTQIK